MFEAVWLFWYVGLFFAFPLTATNPWWSMAWLFGFAWFETLAFRTHPRWTLSGVIGWLIAWLSAGGDRSWYWLADVLAAPIMVLVVYTFSVLVPGWAGWAVGLGLAVPGHLLLRRHWRFMAGK